MAITPGHRKLVREAWQTQLRFTLKSVLVNLRKGLHSIQELAQDEGELLRLFPGRIVAGFPDYSHLAALNVLVH